MNVVGCFGGILAWKQDAVLVVEGDLDQLKSEAIVAMY